MRSKIWIEVGRRFAVGDGSIALLAAVEETGSIREAASKVKWSYGHPLAYLDNKDLVTGVLVLGPPRVALTLGSAIVATIAGLLLHHATRWGVVRL